MPEICHFDGIHIYVYYRDHEPPHVHAKYAGEWVVLAIEDGRKIAGDLHRHSLRIVRQWMSSRTDDLLAAWNAAHANEEPKKVSPPGKGRHKKKGRWTP